MSNMEMIQETEHRAWWLSLGANQERRNQQLNNSTWGWILGQKLRFHSLNKHKFYTRADHHRAGKFKEKRLAP